MACLTLAPAVRAAAPAGDPYCVADYGGAPARSGPPLRFGIDPGLAGSVGGVQLRPPGRVLVARLNRLFWSGGDALVAQFQQLVAAYTGAGLDVELQVRYHP